MDEKPSTLAEALDFAASAWPKSEAFVAPGERLDWETLRAGARRMAAGLFRLGVRSGDHVGILLGNGGDWLRSFYACGILGAVAVPLSTRFRIEELRFCLEHADISTLLFPGRFLSADFREILLDVEPALAARLPGRALPRLERAVLFGDGLCPEGAVHAAALEAEEDPPRVPVSSEDLLLMQFTSGTTSFPKGVLLTHGSLLGNAEAAAERMGVRQEDRYFSIRPFHHVAGTTLSILVSLVRGACLLTLPRFDVAQALSIMAAERATLTSGNDTIFLMLLGHPDLDRSRLCLRGGWAAAGPEVMSRIFDELGAEALCNAYGLSEASPNVAMSRWEDPRDLKVQGRMLPQPGVEVRIVDPGTGEEMARGLSGEIQVRGPNVMRGYYKRPDETSRTITPEGWLRTGDLGELGSDGRLRMVGRLKEMFRVGGENVAPAEVEGTLLRHAAVLMAQVVGVPDPRLGEVPAAYVVLKPGASATVEDLIAWCRERSASFKVPRFLRVVESFEHIGMTGSSKVQKSRLREHALRDLGLSGETK